MNAAQLGFWAILLAGAVRLGNADNAGRARRDARRTLRHRQSRRRRNDGARRFHGRMGRQRTELGVGLILGGVAGGFLGLLMGLAVLKGGVNQIVAGIAITLLGIGLADYFFQIWQPSGRSAVVVPLVPILRLPLLDRLPLIGEALFAQSPLSYLAVAAVRRRKLGVAADDAGIKPAFRRRRSRSRAVARRRCRVGTHRDTRAGRSAGGLWRCDNNCRLSGFIQR